MDEAPAEAYSKRKTSRENAERRRTWRAAGLATERYRIRFRIRSTTKWRGRGATCPKARACISARSAASQGPPRRAAVRGLSGGSRQGSARRQPLQPPRQQGQPVALKSGDGKIGESFGEGRRNPSGEGLPPPLPKPHPSTSQDFYKRASDALWVREWAAQESPTFQHFNTTHFYKTMS